MRCPTLGELPPPPVGKTGWPWTETSRELPERMPDGSGSPRLSIVTPSYHQGQFIEETIRSVLLQGYPDIEYIVIDGGSTDGTVEVLKKYEPWLTHWASEPDRGQAHALNKGFGRATGEILGFLNSDDLYQPGALARVADAYRTCRRPDRFWHAFAVEDFDAKGTRLLVRPKRNCRLADWVDNVAYLHQPGVFWSRELHAVVGGFDEEFQFAFDRTFFATAILKGYRYAVDPGFVTTRFRYHNESKTVKVGEVNNFGFAEEFIRISQWLRHEASLGQHVRILLGRWGRGLEAQSSRMLMNPARHRLARFGQLALAGLLYPPTAASRFYWGAVRRVLFDVRELGSDSVM